MEKPTDLLDVDLVIKSCEGLPRMDLVGHADPYIMLYVQTPDGREVLKYKTAVIYNTKKPTWDEEINLQNVPVGSWCSFKVMDKDTLTEHDEIGTCQFMLDEQAINGTSDEAYLPCMRLPIQPAPGVRSPAGELMLELCCRQAQGPPGPLLHAGPVRYRMAVSTLAGALTGHSHEDEWMAYVAYKLSLAAVPHFFPQGASNYWNTTYPKARQVFYNPAIMAAVKAQHAMLYADDKELRRRGALRGGGGLVNLLRGGVREQQRRYYTYVITEDGSMCFSETGAAFFSDFMSKHAMHAGCSEKVVYAGEFCLIPPDYSQEATSAADEAALAEKAAQALEGTNADGWRLVIDNNSGTFAPQQEQLEQLKALMEHNFKGLDVEVLHNGDTRLETYQSRVPSRVRG